MKKYFFGLLFSGISLAVFAQSDIQKVTDRQLEFNFLLAHPDSVAFEKLLSDSLSYGHSAWKIENKKGFFEDVLHSGAALSQIDMLSQTVSIAGDNAVVRQTFTADLTNAGQVTKLKLGVLLVWQKQKKEWRLLARQAVKIQ